MLGRPVGRVRSPFVETTVTQTEELECLIKRLLTLVHQSGGVDPATRVKDYQKPNLLPRICAQRADVHLTQTSTVELAICRLSFYLSRLGSIGNFSHALAY